jgi:hypothetical protein
VKTVDASISTPRALLCKAPLYTSRSVIAFNVPESSSAMIADWEPHDRSLFLIFSEQLGYPDIPIERTQRLRRSSDPKYAHLPRPLRVIFPTVADLEKILTLQQAKHDRSDETIRIRPDRNKYVRIDHSSETPRVDDRRRRSIIVHNVPALEGSDGSAQAMHDLEQWRFLALLIGLSELAVIGVNRLPRPAHLASIIAPRLLRITFLTEEMAEKAFAAWPAARILLPVGIRYHSDRPRDTRTAWRKLNESINPNKVVKEKTLDAPQIPTEPIKDDLKNVILPSFP